MWETDKLHLSELVNKKKNEQAKMYSWFKIKVDCNNVNLLRLATP
jgi:hypothetical protein